jgi:hypothetical protein
MNGILMKRFLAAIILSVLATVWGCGTSDYDRRMEARREEINKNSQFTKYLNPPAEVAGTTVTLSIPKDMDPPPANADPRRSKNHVLEITGEHQDVYEGLWTDDKGVKKSYYFYVYIITAAKNRKMLPGRYQQECKNATDLDNKFQADRAEGGSINWQTFSAPGNWDFYKEDNGPHIQQMPGTFNFFAHDENDVLVILAWRVPDDIRQALDIDTKMKLVAGTVAVKPSEKPKSEE